MFYFFPLWLNLLLGDYVGRYGSCVAPIGFAGLSRIKGGEFGENNPIVFEKQGRSKN